MNVRAGRRKEAAPYHHGDLRKSLIDAALALVKEEQNWTFSLREVARRAGVSHNAPYNHFADKRDLLAAVAVAGFESLQHRMAAAITPIKDSRAAFIKSGCVYVQFGVENPAHYRLMFSSELLSPEGRPASVEAAGAATRTVLQEIIRHGVASGVFPSSLSRKSEMQMAVQCAWAAVHGLTMLTIDRLGGVHPDNSDRLATKLGQIVCQGLTADR